MSTWHKVGSNGEYRGTLVLPDEFEQYIRRLEAERDEERKSAQEWGDLWRKMNDLRVRATVERNEARRWAIHYKRMYEATQIEQAVNDANAAYEAGVNGMAREAVASVRSKGRKAKEAK